VPAVPKVGLLRRAEWDPPTAAPIEETCKLHEVFRAFSALGVAAALGDRHEASPDRGGASRESPRAARGGGTARAEAAPRSEWMADVQDLLGLETTRFP